MAAPMKAIVKSCLSGSSVVLRGRQGPQGQPPKERTLYLADINCPRMGNQSRPDEPFAFEARDFLRLLVVGKEVGFNISYTIPAANGPALEFGDLTITASNTDVGMEMVKSGWAKVKEGRGKEGEELSERKTALKAAEEEARKSSAGLWQSESEAVTDISQSVTDSSALLSQWKGKQVDAIVEQVLNGTTLRIRLLLSPKEHQILSIQMAGARAPRAPNNNASDDSAEEQGAESQFFAASRLLQRNVSVELLGLPPNATPSTPFIGVVHHPAGSISSLLLSYGLARVEDRHATFLGAEKMANMRKAEHEAKVNKRGIWKSHAAAPTNGVSKKGYEALVIRIWSGDAIGVREGKEGNGPEKRITLSSVRSPRPTDPQKGGLANDAREALRKRIIGKAVHVHHDYTKTKEGDYEEKECCTVKMHNGSNVAEFLVEKGLVSVIKHRRDDEDRSAELDKLLIAEEKAQSEGKGVHSNKDSPLPRIGDASESAAKASSFLPGFKRAGRIPVVVDFVASGSRFKVFLPKQDVKATLVLSGIRAPRTARNATEKSESYGAEAHEFATRKTLQRDAEMEVEATDKSGGFIGALYLSKTDNFAVMLAREGYATVSEYGLDRITFARELQTAEEEAKSQRRNLWADFDEAAVAEQEVNGKEEVASRKEYVDLLISDSRPSPFSFSVQILKNGGIPELEKMMKDFSLHHKAPPASAQPFVPRSGDLVSAKFSVDSQWYRARVLRSNPQKKVAEVQFYDYGNSESLSYSQLRPLDQQFRKLEGQAKNAVLSLVQLLGPETDYGAEAFDRFRELTEGRSLVGNIDYREAGQNGALHLTLYDPKDSGSSDSANSINATLVRDGLARVDTKSKVAAAYPQVIKSLKASASEAHRERRGAYEFGDFTADD